MTLLRKFVDHLHANKQDHIAMVDPAVAYADYAPYHRGIESNVFLKRDNGSEWLGVVWPGVSVFPDWFSSNITQYWNNEIATFFNKETGLDASGIWIDMNEPSNFPCYFPCDNPWAVAEGFPPTSPDVRTHAPRLLPGWPCEFQPEGTECKRNTIETETPKKREVVDTPVEGTSLHTRADGKWLGLPGRDLLYPKYAIHNKAAYMDSWNAEHGGISNKTVNTDIIHQNSLAMYDTHNIYGLRKHSSFTKTSNYEADAFLSDVSANSQGPVGSYSWRAPIRHHSIDLRRRWCHSRQVAGRQLLELGALPSEHPWYPELRFNLPGTYGRSRRLWFRRVDERETLCPLGHARRLQPLLPQPQRVPAGDVSRVLPLAHRR